MSKKISQQDLCSDLLNRTILSHIENNKMYPSIPQLEYISNKLGVPINYFFQYDCLSPSYNLNNNSLSIYAELYNQKNYIDIISLFFKSSKDNLELDIEDYFYISMSFFYTNDFINSLKFFRKFLCHYRNLTSEKQKLFSIHICIILNELFNLMKNNNNYEKGIHYLYIAKKYLYTFNIITTKISYIIHNNIGYSYIKKCNYKKVISVLENFIDYSKELVYVNISANIHLILAIAYYNISNYNAALTNIRKCTFFYQYLNKTDLAILTNLNLINIYRYCRNYSKAFLITYECIEKYSYRDDLLTRFLIQECIVLFNTKHFDDVINKLNKLNFSNLSISNKKDYLFMKGHISFINNDYTKSKNYFKRCLNYYKSNDFYYDVSLIYSDLYSITIEKTFLDLCQDTKKKALRKNILIDWYESFI